MNLKFILNKRNILFLTNVKKTRESVKNSDIDFIIIII